MGRSVSEPDHQSKIRNTKPPGIKLIEHTKNSNISFKSHQAIVLIVTFLAYTSYHASRKTTSIIKNALDPQTQDETKQSVSFSPLSWFLGTGWPRLMDQTGRIAWRS
ncbi:hypothetical protein R6Q57_005259 [Mikania cordata]